MTLEELNHLTRDRFTDVLGGVFEHSPWVAERAWEARPFADLDALHVAMVREVESARRAEQLALLIAHPDLGSRARMSEASTSEQAGAGLDSLTFEEFNRLQQLNQQYRERFDFPFLFAVKGSSKDDVFAALEARRQSEPDDELREALRQVARIARFRLEDLLGERR